MKQRVNQETIMQEYQIQIGIQSYQKEINSQSVTKETCNRLFNKTINSRIIPHISELVTKRLNERINRINSRRNLKASQQDDLTKSNEQNEAVLDNSSLRKTIEDVMKRRSIKISYKRRVKFEDEIDNNQINMNPKYSKNAKSSIRIFDF